MRHTFLILTLLTLSVCGTTAAVLREALPQPAAAAAQKVASGGQVTALEQLIAAGVEQARYTRTYDPAYVAITYPGGDVPRETGVCADVIIRAFRGAGLDLQKEVHEDMAAAFSAYPTTWGARKTDTNIDHRRVGNLMKWSERKKHALPLTKDPRDYQPGDVVAWELDSGRLHIGLVTDIRPADNGPYHMVHNIGAGARIEDVLLAWKIIGHYRYFKPGDMPGAAASQAPAATPGQPRTSAPRVKSTARKK
ncbi:MAG: DUF1287 domain-containing protein [Blastocatellia bacterium]